jgi:hypothetical protein
MTREREYLNLKLKVIKREQADDRGDDSSRISSFAATVNL